MYWAGRARIGGGNDNDRGASPCWDPTAGGRPGSDSGWLPLHDEKGSAAVFRMTPEAVVSFLAQTALFKGQPLLQPGASPPSVGRLVAGRASLHFREHARLLMARKLLAPSAAVHIVAD
jgi:hypothetical protein